MENKILSAYLNSIYLFYYREKWYWKEEIWQIMWKALLDARKRYKRFAGISRFEDYAEKVITKNVNKWISENNLYAFGYKSLNETFWDSDEEKLPTYLSFEEEFCPIELYDFISGLSLIKYIICKEYILRRTDDDIVDRLNISYDRLNELKLELQDDFRNGYLIT